MKTTLSALTITLFAALSGLAVEPAKPSPSKSAIEPCTQCAQAPCHCGFSPSYYTQYRKPVHRVLTTFAPITPHWTRPRPCSPTVNPFAVYSTVGTARPVAHRYGHHYGNGAKNCYDGYAFSAVCHLPRVLGGTLVPTPRRAGVVPTLSFHKALSNAVPGTLVPNPRRPRTVPAVTPKVIPAVHPRTSLGYVPHRSWSRGGAPRGGLRTARTR